MKYLIGKVKVEKKSKEFLESYFFEQLDWGKDIQGKAIFDFLVRASNEIKNGEIVVDAGAGQCRYKPFFDHGKYLAIDSQIAGKVGKRDFSQLNCISNIVKLPFKKESVNYVINTTTLEHLNDPFSFVREVYRVLQPGGKLFLYVPFVQPEHGGPYDYYRYTRYGLAHLFRSAGFKSWQIEPSNGGFYTSIRFVNMYLDFIPDKHLLWLVRKILKVLFRFVFTPIFYWLDTYDIKKEFPVCFCCKVFKGNQKNL